MYEKIINSKQELKNQFGQQKDSETKRAIINGKTIELKQTNKDGIKRTKTLLNGAVTSLNIEYPDGSSEQSSIFSIENRSDIVENPITISPNFSNFTAYQRKDDLLKKEFTEKWRNPLFDKEGKVFGEQKAIEKTNMATGEKTITTQRELDTDEGTYKIDTQAQVYGGEIVLDERTMTVNNKLTGSKETIEYLKDKDGNEIYTYKENGKIGEKIVKNLRGTTIDIYKNGQPYETYEYDQEGKALIPMGKLEELPQNYVENCFNISIPEHELIPHREPKEISMGIEAIERTENSKTKPIGSSKSTQRTNTDMER